MTGWLPALRIARREARRARGRSVLVIALIGLPVFALTFAAISYDSFRLTTAQEIDREMGTADALLRWDYDSPTRQDPRLMIDSGGEVRAEPATAADLLAVLPPGSRVLPLESGLVSMRTPAGIGTLNARALDLADPIVSGLAVLRDGRAPRTDAEVALTAQAVRRLGAAIGDTVRTAHGSARYTVVGTVEFPASLVSTVVFRPGAMPADDDGPPAHRWRPWLVTTPNPITWDHVKQLNQHGILVRSRAVLLDPPPAAEVDLETSDGTSVAAEWAVGGLIAGMGLLEVVLLAGPAFAVGTRRRQRDLALVAANGGAPDQLRRIVLADGVVLGLAGAAVGVALGAVMALGARPLLEEHIWQARAGGYRLFPLALLGIAGLAVLTGLLAALVPAVAASRQQVVAALSGRRGIVRSRKRWLALGLVMVALGTATAAWGAWQVSANVVLAGLVIGELGLVLCTPTLVGLIARGGRLVPLAPRIALRDTARNRAAAAPAISAVMAAVAGTLALGIFMDSEQARYQGEYLPALPVGSAAVSYQWWTYASHDRPYPDRLAADGQEQVRAAMGAMLPVDRLLEVRVVACPPDATSPGCAMYVALPPENQCPFWQLAREPTVAEQRAAAADDRCHYQNRFASMTFADTVVDDGALLPVLTGASAAEVAAATAVLRDGGVVVTNPQLLRDGQATVMTAYYDPAGDEEVTEHAITVPGYGLTTAVGPETNFLSPAALAASGLTTEPIALVAVTTGAPTQAQRDALTAALTDIDPNLRLYVEQGAQVRQDPRLLMLAIAAAVVTLGAAGIATGLAAADRRADLSTLAAVGASPRVRRLLALSQSGVIAGLGTLLGVGAGVGAAFAVLFALNRRETTIWPPPSLYPIDVPWSALAILLVVPLVAMLGAGLLTRSRLPIERRLT